VNSDASPTLSATDVRDIELFRFSTKKPAPQQPLIQLAGVAGALIQGCNAAEGTGVFLELKGTANKEIALDGNRLAKATKAIDYTDGASSSALEKQA
jgi:hypothetical protein